MLQAGSQTAPFKSNSFQSHLQPSFCFGVVQGCFAWCDDSAVEVLALEVRSSNQGATAFPLVVSPVQEPPWVWASQVKPTKPACLCAPGQFCTEDVDECQLQPNACQNGGTCTNHNGGYACVCVNGWSGDDCSKNIDDCFTASCANGSTCIDRVASFSCICPEGKAGEGTEHAASTGGAAWGLLLEALCLFRALCRTLSVSKELFKPCMLVLKPRNLGVLHCLCFLALTLPGEHCF